MDDLCLRTYSIRWRKVRCLVLLTQLEKAGRLRRLSRHRNNHSLSRNGGQSRTQNLSTQLIHRRFSRIECERRLFRATRICHHQSFVGLDTLHISCDMCFTELGWKRIHHMVCKACGSRKAPKRSHNF